MKIYNSLTREKEDFSPLTDQVKIYTCGVTVYDQCHIGHARSLYIFDVIRRYLERRDFKVDFVRNITDIDDKIINRANELKVGWKELVEKYIGSYNDDLESLGISKGISGKDGEEPRATKNIPDMIEHIKGLIGKDYAYEIDGDVYFSVRKFSDYGKLSGQSPDQMLEGVRIKTDQKKQDPLDFALWKRSKVEEPSWDSPWGKGRPGWHIECSVMSQKFLKTDTLDIHGGGRDLIFPHHENEIAQAEALTGKQFARYWIHHGLLTIDGQKMSKSLGNFVTIKDALKKYNADALKIFYLQAHYSSPIDFTEKSMQEAETALERFHIFFDKAERIENTASQNKNDLASTQTFVDRIWKLEDKFVESMDDDFNTSQALGCLFEMLREVNKSSDLKEGDILSAAWSIKQWGNVLGLFLKKREVDLSLKTYAESKIKEREEARRAKDFKKADKIREELQKKGIMLEDAKEGTVWRKHTVWIQVEKPKKKD